MGQKEVEGSPAKCISRLWEGKNERDGEGPLPLSLSGFIGRFAIYSSTSERMNKLSSRGTKKAAFYACLTSQSPFSAKGKNVILKRDKFY